MKICKFYLVTFSNSQKRNRKYVSPTKFFAKQQRKYRNFTYFPGELPETQRKQCPSAKFLHQKIRLNFIILCSRSSMDALAH